VIAVKVVGSAKRSGAGRAPVKSSPSAEKAARSPLRSATPPRIGSTEERLGT
jgi:hypothetical protein